MSRADDAIEGRDDPIEAMAAALVGRFGARAGEVAQRQLALSQGDAATSWAAILAAIRKHSAQPPCTRDIPSPDRPMA